MTRSELCSFVRYSPRFRPSTLRQAQNAKEMCTFFYEACYAQTPLHFDLARAIDSGLLKGHSEATLHVQTEHKKLIFSHPVTLQPRNALSSYLQVTSRMEQELRIDPEKILSKDFYFHPPTPVEQDVSSYIASSIDVAVLWELHRVREPFEKESVVALYAESLLDDDDRHSLWDMTYRLLNLSYIPVRWDAGFAKGYNHQYKKKPLRGLKKSSTPEGKLLTHLVQAEKARLLYEDKLRETASALEHFEQENDTLKKNELGFELSALSVYRDMTKLTYQKLLDACQRLKKTIL